MKVIPFVMSALGTNPKGLVEGQEGWKSEDEKRPSKLHDCHTEKSLGGLRIFVVIQTPVKDHQLTLVRKLACSNVDLAVSADHKIKLKKG